MSDVTGSIGNEQVILNNAATESTLQQLLSTVQGKAGVAASQQVATTAAIAGINSAGTGLNAVAGAASGATVAGTKFGHALGRLHLASDVLKGSIEELDKSFGPLISKLMQGSAQASDVFGALTKLPGPLGAAATVFQKVAAFQEQNLKTYQAISTAGANFGGSLTQMRMAMINTYMTLDQFTNLMKTNGETFAKMGSNANDGAIAFTKLSNSLLKSEAGSELRALGYTTEQVNQGMLTYIAATGGRTKKELQNTDAITKSTVEYLSHLDALAVITGKTREEQEAQMKERAANEAWQAHLLTLGIEERNKAEAAANEARVRGGKGAEQALMSAAMGFPPMTKAAQEYTTITRNANDATMKLVGGIKDSSKTVKDIQRDGAAITAGLAKDGRENSQLFKALQMQGGEQAQIAALALGAANKTQVQEIKNATDARKQLEQVQAEQEKRKKESEARAAVDAEKAIQEMGQSLMEILLPAIKALTPIVNETAKIFSSLVTTAAEYKNVTIGLVGALGAYLLAQKIATAKKAAEAAAAAGAGAAGRAGSIFGRGPLGSVNNPMYVIVMGRIPGGMPGRGQGGRGTPPRTPTPAPGIPPAGTPPGTPAPGTPVPGTQPPQPNQPPANREERLRKVEEGRAAQEVAKNLKGAGLIGALFGLAATGSELYDIKKQKDEGKISEEEAKKQTGGTVGEAAGGLGGGLAGAAAGAAIGSVIPLFGTAIGGLLGGVLGAYGGGWLGKSAGEKLMGPDKTEESRDEKPKPKMADGGFVTQRTEIIAGEAGTEMISGLRPLENLRTELETLNKQSAEMIKYLKETADYAKRNVDATKSLNGDFFKF